ncbi:hypothetical protein K493DRAFT_61131 [Basidiobolus meristosporus CBS 931.73]|uniref:Uncharacterized protein n=1 Tax=Basidiobolus meristosporus CBS 931.73 TaxID=1314790 RepID=A0A1Y1XXJ2_9FUNG|nr:hypothetical protein K493DRAFT_61131 [Basidiobolus meristosporus CBS 931.73]|eukprot:ORX90206.1 hypothetical protein K493DRAFT_61131 [Basidiobolus meristosporus CBS 931.73]
MPRNVYKGAGEALEDKATTSIMKTRSKTRNSISNNPDNSSMISDPSAPKSGQQRQGKSKIEREDQTQQNQPHPTMTNEIFDAPVEGEFLKSSYQ